MTDDVIPTARPCPICGKASKPEFRPFCSARCADVDLNRWLSNNYVIPAEPVEVENEPSTPPQQGEEDE